MYEIKVLSDKEFFDVAKSDKRYSYVDDTNLGFADPMTNKAYVRHVNHPELQKYLINHELEELTTDEHHHQDANGVRHKKFFKDIFSFFTYDPGHIFSSGAREEQKQTNAAQDAAVEQQKQQESQQQQLAQMFGSYSPQGQTGISGSPNSPMNLFTGSGSYSPGNVPDAASGSYTPGFLGQSADQLPDYLKQQKFGSEDGRIVF